MRFKTASRFLSINMQHRIKIASIKKAPVKEPFMNSMEYYLNYCILTMGLFSSITPCLKVA